MTASECASAIWHAVLQVGFLRNLSTWRKLQILALKVIAIIGYHYGKFIAMHSQSVARRPAEPTSFELHGAASEQFLLDKASHTAVVMPVFAAKRSEITFLLRTVELLLSSDRAPGHIILVDDAGPCPLPTFSGPRSKVTVVRLARNSGPAAARNVGLEIAKRHGAALVCFLDDDCVPEPGWLTAMEAAQLATPGIVCGRTIASDPTTLIGMYHDVCGTLNGRVLADGSLLYGCTCNLSLCPGSVHIGFDAAFLAAAFEDVEFCVRARKRGISLAYANAAVVRHHYVGGLWGLFCQFRRYGLYEAQMCERHPEYLDWLWSSREISSYPQRSAARGGSRAAAGA